MELPKTSYKETRVNKVNQGTYFKLKPTDTARYCSSMGKRPL